MIDIESIYEMIALASGIALATTTIIKPIVDAIRLHFGVQGRATLHVVFGLGQLIVWIVMLAIGTPLTPQSAALIVLAGIIAALGSKGLTETQRKADAPKVDADFLEMAEGLAPPINLDDVARAQIRFEVQQALDNYFSPADSPIKD